jgi:hypothetical protein
MVDQVVAGNTRTTAPSWRERGAGWWHMWLQGGLVFLVLALAAVMPRADAIFLFLLGALSLFHAFAVQRSPSAILRGSEETWFLAALFTLAAYLFANSLWAVKPDIALGKAAFFLALVLTVLLVTQTFARQSARTLDRTAAFAVWGLVIGSALGCFEFLAGHPLEKAVLGIWPSLRPGEKTIDVFVEMNGQQVRLAEEQFRNHYDNVRIEVASGALGRNLALLMLLAWPVLFMAANRKERILRVVSLSVLVAAGSAAIFVGENQTAQVALAASVLAFLAVKLWPRAAHWGVVAAWCIVVVFAVVLSSAPHKAGLHKAEWLFASARDRIIIWNYTAGKIWDAPILGTGIRSTRFLNRELRSRNELQFEEVAMRRLGMHSHNHFLQIWFELGAVGAFLVLLTGLGMLHRMRKLDGALKPYAYATFAAASVIAAFGWGLWQTWLLSGYMLAIVLVALAAQWADDASRRAAPRP